MSPAMAIDDTAPGQNPAADDPGTRRRFAAFLVMWSGQGASLLGTQAVQFALVWWLTATTGSASVLSLATLVALVPPALLGPWLGAVADRYDRKRVMLGSDLASAAAALVLAGLFAAGAATPWHVLALLFVRAVANALHAPAMLATTTLMVPEQHLGRIQGVNQMFSGGILIVTAPLGAWLVGALSMASVMMVDVATAASAVITLSFIRVPRPPAAAERATPVERPSLLRDVRQGVTFLRGQPGHLGLLTTAAVINLFMVPAYSLLPLLVVQRFGDATALGRLYACFGVGTIAGGLLLAVIGGLGQRIGTSLAALTAMGIANAVLVAVPADTLWWSVATMAAIGVLMPLVNGPILVVLQRSVPADLQGRVFALYTAVSTLMTPLGLALAGPLADLLGVAAWYLAGAAACVLASAAAFLQPNVRRLGQQREGSG